MAQVASERLDQMQDPELSIEQAMTDYRRLGYSENTDPQTMQQHAEVAIKGATVARNARLEMEEVLGEKVVTSLNAKLIQKSIEDKNEKE